MALGVGVSDCHHQIEQYHLGTYTNKNADIRALCS